MKLKFRAKLAPKELRQKRIDELSSELKESKAVILFTSTTITHQQFEQLRRDITPNKVRFVKNTLFSLATQEVKLPVELRDEKILFEQTGVIMVMTDDVVEPLKTFVKLFKEQVDSVKFKIAWIDNTVYMPEVIKQFASMPSKEQLYGRLVASLSSPLYGLHRSLSWDMTRLVMALNQISSKQS